MQVCKYFQHKTFPYFVVKELSTSTHFFGENFSYTTLNEEQYEWERIEDIPDNICIINGIFIELSPQRCFISQLVPKIVACEVKILNLDSQKLTIGEFKALSFFVEVLVLYGTFIFDGNNRLAPLEVILDCLPKAEEIQIQSTVLDYSFPLSTMPSFSSIDAAKKVKLLKLRDLELQYIPHIYNVAALLEFMNQNKSVDFFITFVDVSYFPYGEKLQEYVDAIIEAWDFQNPPPIIDFPGQTMKSKDALWQLQREFARKKIR
uniref:Uncharacterized protein n=1 Tax=Panagrolaimus sp. ES5 TaxID=591445 RepID=A0AC34G1L0_9BILA